MNTTDFIKQFAYEYQMSETETEDWVRAILEYLAECIVRENEVRLAGIGAFQHYCVTPHLAGSFKKGTCEPGGLRMTEPKMHLQFNPTSALLTKIKALPPDLSLTKKSIHEANAEKNKMRSPTRKAKQKELQEAIAMLEKNLGIFQYKDDKEDSKAKTEE